MLSKEMLLEQNKIVQAELAGIAKGYEQALGWMLSVIQKDQVTETANSGETVVANQEK